MDKDFLLNSDTSRQLYFEYTKNLPHIDYHNHLSPQVLAENRPFPNMTKLWLGGDHYKWMAMRALGVKEDLITGKSTDEQKFHAWARSLPMMVRNPLFHWSHMELESPFGVTDYLNGETAQSIYERCNHALGTDAFRPVELMKKFNVEFLGTTDDPCDDLHWHKALRKKSPGFAVRPTFRPDRILHPAKPKQFFECVDQLAAASRRRINSMDSLLEALLNRMEYFHSHGCRISDHGLQRMPGPSTGSSKLRTAFRSWLTRRKPTVPPWADELQGLVLTELCKAYHAKGWVQQFHLGPMRNVNTRLYERLGPDAGTDSMGDEPQAERLARFLDFLDQSGQLTKTILYPINPSHNEVFATIAGSFNEGPAAGKVQLGSAWWFLDQKEGIERQINALSSMGIVGTFVGMTTDSRSFLSFSRHEYFRRVVCNLFGEDMSRGLLPNDIQWIGGIVQRICYGNAKEYFSFPKN